MTSITFCCCPPFSNLFCCNISLLPISIDSLYLVHHWNITNPTPFVKCQRVMEDNDNNDNIVDNNSPINTLIPTWSQKKWSNCYCCCNLDTNLKRIDKKATASQALCVDEEVPKGILQNSPK